MICHAPGPSGPGHLEFRLPNSVMVPPSFTAEPCRLSDLWAPGISSPPPSSDPGRNPTTTYSPHLSGCRVLDSLPPPPFKSTQNSHGSRRLASSREVRPRAFPRYRRSTIYISFGRSSFAVFSAAESRSPLHRCRSSHCKISRRRTPCVLPAFGPRVFDCRLD